MSVDLDIGSLVFLLVFGEKNGISVLRSDNVSPSILDLVTAPAIAPSQFRRCDDRLRHLVHAPVSVIERGFWAANAQPHSE